MVRCVMSEWVRVRGDVPGKCVSVLVHELTCLGALFPPVRTPYQKSGSASAAQPRYAKNESGGGAMLKPVHLGPSLPRVRGLEIYQKNNACA